MTWRLLLPLLLLAGCMPSTVPTEQPARLLDPDAESRAELEAVVAAALGQSSVQLAADALTEDGVLLIERMPRTDPLGHRLPGRDLGTPTRFQLLRVGDRCVLGMASGDARWVLEKARCIPLSSP